VRDVALHEKAIEKVRAFAAANELEIAGVLPSHLAGAEGNLEYFLHARRKG
jgi:predicted rRNA methylase YqxC with S4 and FtsJ domains